MEIICYLSNGYPTIESSYDMAVNYAEAGCNMIEIDFPSHNPYLEGEYIADRMAKALKECDDFDKYMDGMIKIKKRLPNINFILMVYENTIEVIGVEKFIDFCLVNNFKDIIIVGLKDETIKNKVIEKGLRVSCYVQYQLLEEEIEYAKKSNGFVYLQAKPTNGITHPKYKELKECIQYLREKGIKNPIYCGVGIHAPEDVRMVKEAGGDAAFVGSTILKLQNDIPKMKEAIGQFKKECL